MKVHSSVTTKRIMDTAINNEMSLDNTGICLSCGEDNDGCEPDARKYTCEFCDEPQVYGAMELAQNVM